MKDGRVFEEAHEGEQRRNDERGSDRKREKRRERHEVTIPPNGAGFCNAFPPDYTNDQFEAV